MCAAGGVDWVKILCAAGGVDWVKILCAAEGSVFIPSLHLYVLCQHNQPMYIIL